MLCRSNAHSAVCNTELQKKYKVQTKTGGLTINNHWLKTREDRIWPAHWAQHSHLSGFSNALLWYITLGEIAPWTLKTDSGEEIKADIWGHWNVLPCLRADRTWTQWKERSLMFGKVFFQPRVNTKQAGWRGIFHSVQSSSHDVAMATKANMYLRSFEWVKLCNG